MIVTLYLGIKTVPDESWSGWSMYSAQTMLSTEHWAKNGFIESKLLFAPIGYSKITRLLDEPEMRQHARGTVTGDLIGRRLYYTHYPSGYLVPYALLMKVGVTERAWFRLLSLAMSVAALALMYRVVTLLSTPMAAFFSTLYYAASTMFLDFADSLANQPLDDLLRFLVMLISLRAANEKNGWRYPFVIWAIYFTLSISSYDSVFFLFIWLVCVDAAKDVANGVSGIKLLRIKRRLLYASAPAAAFACQVAQNWWYLGFNDMLLDFKGTFFSRTSVTENAGFFANRINALSLTIKNTANMDAAYAAVVIIALSILFIYLKKKLDCRLPDFSVVAALAAGGAAFLLVFAYTARFDYQGRQLMPFMAVLTGGATVIFMRLIAGIKDKRVPYAPLFALVLAVTLAFTWQRQIERSVRYVSAWPNHMVDRGVIEYFKGLHALSPDDTVIMTIDPLFEADYPQPIPFEEYYAGGTIMNFRNLNDLARDYAYLKRRANYPFHPLIISHDRSLLAAFAAITGAAPDIRVLNGDFVLLTDG